MNQNQNRLQILGGDFNAEPHEDSIRVLSEHWKDTYATQYPDDNGYTFPTNDPIKRIDYFFMNDVVKQVNYDVKIIGREPTKETLQYIEVSTLTYLLAYALIRTLTHSLAYSLTDLLTYS